MYESVSGSDNADLTRRVIDLVSNARAGIVTDIDGTISPIVARPEEAMVLPAARNALEGLNRYLELVGVVTGRSVSDARQMVGVEGITYIGNHGMEVYRNGHAEVVDEARPWVPRIASVLDVMLRDLDPSLRQGVIVENKGATASIHYRLAPEPETVRTALLQILAGGSASGGVKVEEGRRVLNLLPPLEITKGSAVSWLIREHKLEAIVFLGDDITDVHAFRALELQRQAANTRTLNIGVVGPETPASVRQLADACVPSANAVAELLSGVLAGLESSDTMTLRAPSAGST